MLKINELARLYLGVKNENLSRTINIDMSAWAELYPNATAVILHKRQGDETKELTGAEYDNETMILSWTPTSYDTFYEGFGIAEIRMVEGEVVKKSKDLLVTAVAPSIIDGSGEVVASDYQAWLDSVIGYKQGAVAAKNDAVSAKNDAIAAKQAAEAALNMTDIAGAEAETLEPGSDATAEIVTTQDGKKILFGIPQGERGETGSGGLNGVKMNGNDMPVDENGIAQLGTVLTAHQSLDGKADIIISTRSSQDVANVKDATSLAVRELVLKINPIQSGTGDPSPDNIRAISGRSSVVLYQSGSDTSDPTEHTASIPTPPGTVYGGEIDWVRQKLKVTHAIVDMGDLTWEYNSSQLSMVSRDLIDSVGDGQNFFCSHYKKTSNIQGSALSASDKVIAFNKRSTTTTGNFSSGVLVVKDTDYSNADTFKTAMNGAQICYELATPIEYDLSSLDEITLALGENNLWIDDGQVKLLEYYCDTTLYVNERTDDKAKKPSSATNNNFAALDANGNLKDSGHKHSEYLTSHQDISGKLDKANVYNGLDKTSEGYALDARMGYALSQSDSNIRKGLGYQAKLTGGNWQLNSGTDAAAGDYIWVNGQLGRATAAITGGSTNIVENTNWVKVEALNEIGAAVTNLQEGFALIENGDTASQNIAAGTYVLHKGVLKKASSAIASGDTLSGSNLSAVTGGGMNDLNAKVNGSVTTAIQQDSTDVVVFNKVGQLVLANFNGYTLSQYQNDDFIPAAYQPADASAFFVLLYKSASDNYVGSCNINTSGRLYVRRKNAAGTRDETVSGYKMFGTAVWLAG